MLRHGLSLPSKTQGVSAVSHTKEAMWHLVLSATILTALIGEAAAAGTTEKTPPPNA